MNDLQFDPTPVPDHEQRSNLNPEGIHARLIPLLQEMFDAQQTIVLTLNDSERNENGTFDNWSLKDTLAHIVAWNDILNLRLDLLARGETPEGYEDADSVNAEFYQERAKLSWSAVLESSRKSFTTLIERLDEFTEEQLVDPGHYAWLTGRPLWQRVLGTAYVHPQIHLAYYYQQHGKSELGLKLQLDAADKLLAFDQDPVWQSQVNYNLACQYALYGEKSVAIDKLRLALQLDQSLLEWSTQDPDFDTIRNDPEFQAIYSEFEP